MKHVALLRGINVSGQKIIKMADLRSALEQVKEFEQVSTYIQSGNIVVESALTDQRVGERIHDVILNVFGFEVPVLMTDYEHLITIQNQTPFPDSIKPYVIFLDRIPEPEHVSALDSVKERYEPETYVLHGNILYFHSPLGYGKAKMSTTFFEKKLKVLGTARNWNTIQKLIDRSAPQ
ncbi:MAG: DUF1697 domain-containing protein [Bacteroidota bacterium]